MSEQADAVEIILRRPCRVTHILRVVVGLRGDCAAHSIGTSVAC
jgi:hypothetical protein